MSKDSMHDEIMRDARSTQTVRRIASTPNFCAGKYRYTGLQVYYMQRSNPNVRLYPCGCGSYHKAG